MSLKLLSQSSATITVRARNPQAEAMLPRHPHRLTLRVTFKDACGGASNCTDNASGGEMPAESDCDKRLHWGQSAISAHWNQGHMSSGRQLHLAASFGMWDAREFRGWYSSKCETSLTRGICFKNPRGRACYRRYRTLNHMEECLSVSLGTLPPHGEEAWCWRCSLTR